MTSDAIDKLQELLDYLCTDSPVFPEYMVIGEIVELDVDEFRIVIDPEIEDSRLPIVEIVKL